MLGATTVEEIEEGEEGEDKGRAEDATEDRAKVGRGGGVVVGPGCGGVSEERRGRRRTTYGQKRIDRKSVV